VGGSSARQHATNRHQAYLSRPHQADDTPQLGGERKREPVDSLAITQGWGSLARQHTPNRHQAHLPQRHQAEDTPQLGGEETRELVDPLASCRHYTGWEGVWPTQERHQIHLSSS